MKGHLFGTPDPAARLIRLIRLIPEPRAPSPEPRAPSPNRCQARMALYALRKLFHSNELSPLPSLCRKSHGHPYMVVGQ